MERLKGESHRTVLTALPGSRSARLDVYCSHQKAQSLLKYFGGRVYNVQDLQWKTALEGTSKPISIRGKLVIYGNQTSFRNHSTPAIPLFFPAEMAFGSGSHATTASCLRILCDLQPQLHPNWHMLDLGTGSGILAIAACALGAGKVLAVDFDPVALRIARRNWHNNRSIVMNKKDILCFKAMDIREDFPVGKYQVICANLFDELLIAIASRMFHSLEKGGWWVFSGVLAKQIPQVLAAMNTIGFDRPIIRHRGKWIAGFAQKPG